LNKSNQAVLDHRGRFAPTVKKAFSRGALILAIMDGHDFKI